MGCHCDKSLEYVALRCGQELGLLSYDDWRDRSLGYIQELHVLSDVRQQGVGSTLLRFAESIAVQLSCRTIRLKPYALDHDTDLPRLIAWYEKMGYSPSLECKGDWQKGLSRGSLKQRTRAHP